MLKGRRVDGGRRTVDASSLAEVDGRHTPIKECLPVYRLPVGRHTRRGLDSRHGPGLSLESLAEMAKDFGRPTR